MCPFTILLNHHCPLPAALADSKVQAGHEQLQRIHQPMVDSQMQPPPQLSEPQQGQFPQAEEIVPNVGARQPSGDRMQGKGMACNASDRGMGTPETDTCSMEQHPMGSAIGSAHTRASDAATAPELPSAADENPTIDFMAAEPMTQDQVIVDSEDEEQGGSPAQFSTDFNCRHVGPPLQTCTRDDCSAQMLQLDLSSDTLPAASRCTTSEALLHANGINTAALVVSAGTVPPAAVKPHASVDVSPAASGRAEPQAIADAADASHVHDAQVPVHDTLPDSHPTSPQPEDPAGTHTQPSASHLMANGSVNQTAAEPPTDPASAPDDRVAGVTAASHPPLAAGAATTSEAVNITDIAAAANATDAAFPTTDATVADAMLATAAAPSVSAFAPAAEDAADLAVASACAPQDGASPLAGNAGQLQQLLLEAHTPHQAVTGFLWSAVRHIVPQVVSTLDASHQL